MILDKAKMAHDWAIARLASGAGFMTSEIVADAWNYADAMQAAADEHEKAQPVITEQDKKRAEQAYANIVKPPINEWQPDWSQAPVWANWWAMDENKNTRWIYSEVEQPYISDMFLRWCAVGRFDSAEAPSFGYQGKWQDSLRKRPQ